MERDPFRLCGEARQDCGDQRAEMERDVERHVVRRVPPAEQPVRKGQMGRRRDGKELAQTLNHAEDRRLPGSHGART